MAQQDIDNVKTELERAQLNVLRVLRDGDYVVTHAAGALQGDGVFFDIFKLERGSIIEHRALSAKAASVNTSGQPQPGGQTRAGAPGDMEKNKEIARQEHATRRAHDAIELSLGEGDFVFILAKGTHDGKAGLSVGLYRIENDKIAEQWGFSETLPLRELSKHAANGVARA